MKLIMKEWKLCMHPTGYLMPLLAVLVLVPGYPYGVCCFYVGLAIFFICLTAREDHDAGYTLMLPVSRRDAVRGRILFCAALEAADLMLMGMFILIRNVIGSLPNPAGLDAGAALIGDGMIIFALFNRVFFPVYYKDILKPGKAFACASAAVFLWIVLEIVATYTVPFFRDIESVNAPSWPESAEHDGRTGDFREKGRNIIMAPAVPRGSFFIPCGRCLCSRRIGLRRDCVSARNFPMKSAGEEKIQDDDLRICVDKYQNKVYNKLRKVKYHGLHFVKYF